MSRHFKPVSKKDFADKLVAAYKAHECAEPDYMIDLDELETPEERAEAAVHYAGYNIRHLTPKLEADFKKVSWDCENVDASKDAFGYKGLTGLKTLNNGMTYIGITAGGDWECPVFFIIYWNGVSLRGYVPKKGNVWNYKTKEAIGNSDEEDQAFLREYLKDDYVTDQYGGDVSINAQLLESPADVLQDMLARIKPG
jgi:hypothetical protein